MPQFGKIKDIVVVDTEECFFVISVYETEFLILIIMHMKSLHMIKLLIF